MSPAAAQLMRQPVRLLHGVIALAASLPATWQMALRDGWTVGPTLPCGLSAVGPVLRTACWEVPQPPAPRVRPLYTSVLTLTVKQATVLLSQDREAARMAMHAEYVAAALAEPHAGDVPPEQALLGLRQGLNLLWPLRCANHHKQVLWHIALQGVRGAGGHGVALVGKPCPCGWAGPQPGPNAAWERQKHHFWACPVAVTLRSFIESEIRRARPAWVGALECQHLWLLQPPAGLHAGAWAAISAAALAAVDDGRRRLIHLHLEAERAQLAAAAAAQPGPRQLLLHDFWPQPPAAQLGVAESPLASLGSVAQLADEEISDAEGGAGVAAVGAGAAAHGGVGAGGEAGGVALPHAAPRPPPARLPPLQAASRRAVVSFLGRLQDIAAFCGTVQKGWVKDLTNDHPFLSKFELDPEHSTLAFAVPDDVLEQLL